jgi:micrococcal nuclease
MKKSRFSIPIILLVVCFLCYLALAADYKYVGSARSNKYHYPNCEWALKIKPENLITFKSAKEALEAGYVPCKVCTPPVTD